MVLKKIKKGLKSADKALFPGLYDDDEKKKTKKRQIEDEDIVSPTIGHNKSQKKQPKRRKIQTGKSEKEWYNYFEDKNYSKNQLRRVIRQSKNKEKRRAAEQMLNDWEYGEKERKKRQERTNMLSPDMDW